MKTLNILPPVNIADVCEILEKCTNTCHWIKFGLIKRIRSIHALRPYYLATIMVEEQRHPHELHVPSCDSHHLHGWQRSPSPPNMLLSVSSGTAQNEQWLASAACGVHTKIAWMRPLVDTAEYCHPECPASISGISLLVEAFILSIPLFINSSFLLSFQI